jgi:hypothetical protein
VKINSKNKKKFFSFFFFFLPFRPSQTFSPTPASLAGLPKVLFFVCPSSLKFSGHNQANQPTRPASTRSLQPVGPATSPPRSPSGPSSSVFRRDSAGDRRPYASAFVLHPSRTPAPRPLLSRTRALAPA